MDQGGNEEVILKQGEIEQRWANTEARRVEEKYRSKGCWGTNTEVSGGLLQKEEWGREH